MTGRAPRIGYVPYSRDLSHPADARRFPFYAKKRGLEFEIADPPVILSLNRGGTPGTLSHLGIRYPGTADIASETIRTKNAGVDLFRQENATCCYAKADKFWVRDPDDVEWEVYAITDDMLEFDTAKKATAVACCRG